MYDYVDGKVDWMAYGLPVEGDEGPFVGGLVTDAVTVDVTATAGQARSRLREAGADEAIVVDDLQRALGELDDDMLDGADDDRPVLEVMGPVPSTVRPSVTVSSLAGPAPARVVVSTSDGRLLGVAVVEAAEDDDEDNEDGHDHDGDVSRMEQELEEVMKAVADHFGDREPSEDELRAFLRDRLVDEGRSPEEADQLIAGLDEQSSG